MSIRLRAALSPFLLAVACGDDTSSHENATDTTTGSTAGDTESGSTQADETSESATGTSTTQGDAPGETGTSNASSDDAAETTGEVSTALVTITAQDNALLRIDAATGTATEICTLPAAASYDSITFTGDGTLYAHNVAQNRLETINPCNCGFQVVGLTGTGALEITTDGADGLVGLDIGLDAFSIVNPNTGLSTVVGPLGLSVPAAGIAWDFDLGAPIMLEITTNALHVIDTTTGTATHVADLSQSLPAAGMDMLPPTGELFVCADAALHRVDTATGSVTTIGPLGITAACHNLAAPPAAIACLE
jgi:hypothetical protein